MNAGNHTRVSWSDEDRRINLLLQDESAPDDLKDAAIAQGLAEVQAMRAALIPARVDHYKSVEIHMVKASPNMDHLVRRSPKVMM